jgi:hypothetical protein
MFPPVGCLLFHKKQVQPEVDRYSDEFQDVDVCGVLRVFAEIAIEPTYFRQAESDGAQVVTQESPEEAKLRARTPQSSVPRIAADLGCVLPTDNQAEWVGQKVRMRDLCRCWRR